MCFLSSFKRRLKIGFGVLLNKTTFTLSKSLQILSLPLLNLIFQGKTILVFLVWNCSAASAGPWPFGGTSQVSWSLSEIIRIKIVHNIPPTDTPGLVKWENWHIQIEEKNVRYERAWPVMLLCNLSWLWKLPSVSDIFTFHTSLPVKTVLIYSTSDLGGPCSVPMAVNKIGKGHVFRGFAL